MIRIALGITLSFACLAMAARAAQVQVDNFQAAAELDRLALEAEWNARRSSGIKPELMRFEFDLEAEQTRRRGSDAYSS